MRPHSPFAEGEHHVRGAVVRSASPLAAAQARGAGEHACCRIVAHHTQQGMPDLGTLRHLPLCLVELPLGWSHSA